MEEFAGRTAVVTGGASGIGLAMAQRFAAAGMNIVLGDIESEPLAMAEAAIAKLGAKVLAQRTDVAKESDVAALADASFRRFGNVHVLCNNAGVGGSRGAAWDLSADDWRWVIDVDLWSVVHGVRSFVPRMIANGDEGHIVNTASVAGLITGAVGAPYTVAKFAVEAFTEQLYYEFARGGHRLGASVLCPGFVDTNIYDSSRNRQSEYGKQPDSPDAAIARAAMNARRADLLQASDIADLVFEAIRSRNLYIIAPGSDAIDVAINRRLENIRDRANPVVNFPLA